ATVAAREAKGRGPHPILQVTNALARSVTTWADRNEAGIGSNLVYAAIHQFGGDAGRGHQVEIPARRYLPFDENGQLENVGQVMEITMDSIQDGLATGRYRRVR
ncbi:phage virion morphogenesis protein, partial [Pseudomonas aeruginosa]|uniref:phage virion morphogenesis protein n=1 Tax=Pseudomonas aeruginosa TaxID=287 RepID=UPI0008FBB65E